MCLVHLNATPIPRYRNGVCITKQRLLLGKRIQVLQSSQESNAQGKHVVQKMLGRER